MLLTRTITVATLLGLLAATPHVAPAQASAKLPEDLPTEILLPDQVQLKITAARKAPHPEPKTPQESKAARQRKLLNPDLIEATFTRSGNTTHAIYRWEDNQRSDVFQIGNRAFRQGSLEFPEMIDPETDASCFSLTLSRKVAGVPLKPGTFPGLAWYKPDLFVAESVLGGRPVYIFKRPGPPADAPSDMAPALRDTVAYTLTLDQKTKLPLQLETDDFIYRFSYAATPNTTLQPPDKFTPALKMMHISP